jgi:3'(2'), 5'-bisphosphate nucleotidase
MEQLIDLVRAAGDAILEVYGTDFDVDTKADASPVTAADLAAHGVLARGLRDLAPDIPLLSEESEPPGFDVRKAWSRYWLVDPLDGTKEFISRNGEFTVNVALMENGQPTLGIVGVPVRGTVYTGDVAAGEAFRYDNGSATPLGGRPFVQGNTLVVVASRSHGGERLERYIEALGGRFGDVQRTPVGSSLKLCILAEGQADLYPRLGPTSEWDIAAAHAVLAAAGGDVWAVSGDPVRYNKPDSFLNPEFFAVADGQYPWQDRLPPVP